MALSGTYHLQQLEHLSNVSSLHSISHNVISIASMVVVASTQTLYAYVTIGLSVHYSRR